jgi:hypothetical protein
MNGNINLKISLYQKETLSYKETSGQQQIENHTSQYKWRALKLTESISSKKLHLHNGQMLSMEMEYFLMLLLTAFDIFSLFIIFIS